MKIEWYKPTLEQERKEAIIFAIDVGLWVTIACVAGFSNNLPFTLVGLFMAWYSNTGYEELKLGEKTSVRLRW